MADISSIATQAPLSLSPTSPLSAAIDLMAKRGFRRIPIVFDYQIVGILTASDVMHLMAQGEISDIEMELHNFMAQAFAFFENQDVGEAIKYMYANNLSSLPLVSQRDHLLTGIVTERDLVVAFADSLADADLEGFINMNPLVMVKKNQTIGKCIKAMVKADSSRIIFTNSKNKVVGIVTTKDVIRYLHNEIITYGKPTEDIMKRKITEIMIKSPKTINLSLSVADAANFMIENKIGGCPVVDENDEFVGSFSERDILALISTYGLI